jgi:TusA-related sulfurtransferase
MAAPAEDKMLDCRGLLCPMPVVRVARQMKVLQPGQVLKLLATDRGACTDIPAWAEDTGNRLLEWHEESGVLVFLLRKGGGECTSPA